MASYEPLHAVLHSVADDRKEIDDIFYRTQEKFTRIKQELLSNFGEGKDEFLQRINKSLLTIDEKQVIDMATTEPVILILAQVKSALVHWILGHQYLSESWTDRACTTVYKNCINEYYPKDNVNIHEFSDEEKIVLVDMDESGCQPAKDWPESMRKAKRQNTMLIVKTSTSDLLNRGLTVVEAYGCSLATVENALDKYCIVPTVIVYSLDAFADSPERELGTLTSLSKYSQPIFYTIDTDRLSSESLDSFKQIMTVEFNSNNVRHIHTRLYTFPYTADITEDRLRLLCDLTQSVKNRVNIITKIACENLVFVNKRCIDLFVNQLQKMYNRTDDMTLEEVYEVIEENEEQFQADCKRQIGQMKTCFEKSDPTQIANRTEELFWEAIGKLSANDIYDETPLPPMLDYFWAASYCCQRKRRCLSKFETLMMESVRRIFLPMGVVSGEKFHELGPDALNLLSARVLTELGEKLRQFHKEFVNDIGNSHLSEKIVYDIDSARRLHLRDLTEMVAVNELRAQCWLDRARFANIRETAFIARGGEGKVVEVVDNSTGELLAMKVTSHAKISLEALAIEYHYARMLDHENIITILGTQIFQDDLRILMPRMQDLMKYMQSSLPVIEKRLQLGLQVARAVQYLHDQNIFHRDIKWQNVLVDSEGNAKLSDFGFIMTESMSNYTQCGTLCYAAPEIWTGSYDKSVDIYAFGLLLWTLVAGAEPTLPKPSAEVPRLQFARQMSEWRPSRPRDCSDTCWNLMEDCWRVAGERPTIDNLIARLQNVIAEQT